MKAARPVAFYPFTEEFACVVVHIYIYRLNVSMLEGEREEGRKPYLGR